ncbi:Nodule Cysteine-Rich (NCR) secreted peptide [Medicago truncatula]|uniref:Nodule Cysteine-Rich (NCR) secreted peptide n=2 Tax=Medicago truncatula TaxID=3880 RepID=A0A072UB79_MEDTR|nr:Nodule Cysteine-Rich (NCR) secreted peptide [Medicago truncatula]
MAQVFKFIYALIIVLSLFLVETNTATCITDADCPYDGKCIDGFCRFNVKNNNQV